MILTRYEVYSYYLGRLEAGKAVYSHAGERASLWILGALFRVGASPRVLRRAERLLQHYAEKSSKQIEKLQAAVRAELLEE